MAATTVVRAPAASAADISGGWSTVVLPSSSALNNRVYSLLQDGSRVYVGGMFTGAGGATGSYLTSFDSTTAGDWTPVASSALSPGTGYTYVATMAKSGTDLYVGGRFGGGNIAKVASGGTVSALGSGSSGGDRDVEEIAIIGSNVYAGGAFASLGGVSDTAGIGVWNGSAWAALGTGLTSGTGTVKVVNGMAVEGTKLHIGGQFTGLAGVSSLRAVTWETSGTPAAAALGDGFNGGLVAALANGTGGAVTGLFAGGNMTTAGTSTPATTINGIAKLSGSAWTSLGSGLSAGGVIETMAFDSAGNLYVGGSFTSVNGVSANNIAKYDGSVWSSLSCGPNNGVNSAVRAILPQTDGSIIVGGWFTNAGGNGSADYVARYTPGADNCPTGSSDAADPAPTLTIDFDGNGGVCTPASIQGSPGTWGSALTADQCTNGSRKLAFFSTSPTAASGATNVAPGGPIFFLQSNRFYAIWGSDPPSPPTNVVATPGLNSVTVSWNAPTSDGGDPIRVYNVRYKATTDTNFSTFCNTNPVTLQCTAAVPATNTKYTFIVSAANQVGRAEAAPSSPVSPYDFKDITVSRDDVFFGLRGTKVEANGAAPGLAGQALNVQYKIGSAAEWTTVANGVKVNAEARFSWSKRFPASANKKVVTVRFTYGADAVSGTYALPRGGRAGDLSAPRNIKATGELNRISLTWDPPKFDGGAKIIGYTICAEYIGTLCRDVGPAGQGDFRNLLPGAEYSFTVAARTAAKTGPKAKANKNVKFTEASVRITAREPGGISILAEGRGFPNSNPVRLEVAAVPTANQPRDRWRWVEIRSLAAGSRFSKTVEAELGSSYDDQSIAVRLVTPLGSVYSKPSRPPR